MSKQTSGKSSYVRTNILGALVKGIRGTLTVDPDLGPNEIGIIQEMYDKLNLAFPFVILNRDPSINSRCIYVCQLKPFSDKNDFTIHVNQYVLRGLNADQDGDEVTLYYIEKEDEICSLEMTKVMYEILRCSWKYGHRHDVFGVPRYGFSQYQDLMLHNYNDELCKLSKFWNDLQPFSDRKKIAFALACTTHRDEFDEFLDIFTKFCSDVPLGKYYYFLF